MRLPVLIDREPEVAMMARLLIGPGPRLGVLYGRRRVGKTFLLNAGWPHGVETFYFAATDGTPELNRRDLAAEIGRRVGAPLSADDTAGWRGVFEALFELPVRGPVAIVLDEFQYLKGESATVDSVLAAVLETYTHRRRRPHPVAVVLCGSIVRVMERLDAVGNPLHGRFEWRHRLEPFDYWDAARLARFRDLRDRAAAYGIYGGTPRYLVTIDPTDSLASNVVRDVLAPSGAVRTQVETLIEQEQGLRDIAAYKAILGAVGEGHTDRNAVAQRTGLTNDRALITKLDALHELGFVALRRNFEPSGKDPVRYAILDPALRYYYHTVVRQRNALQTNPPRRVWEETLARELDGYMGLAFEDMARQGYIRLTERLRLPLVAEWGRWEGADRDRQSVEIDVVARLTEGAMLTGAVKWNRARVGLEVHAAHVGALKRLAHAGRKWAHEALDPASPLLYVAASGFAPGFVHRAERDGQRVIALTLRQLYAASG
jgi:AAA+ ATPase superfamily predicted ATPase